MSVRLRIEQDDNASPAHKRVRLSLSPAALAKAARGSPIATHVQTATPDLFDATPTEATGVAPGRRKSSRSRVYTVSQRSSGGSAKADQHRSSTGATDLVSNAPTQVRLSSGAPRPDGELALYHLLEDSSPRPTSPTSPLLRSAKTNRSQLAVKQSPQQQGLACVQRKHKELSGSPGTKRNYEIQPKQEQDANKENLLMEVHIMIPRFNMIERALVLAVLGKLTREAYKFMVSDLVSWTTTVLNANNIRGCTEQELLAVLQVRDNEECVMLSAQDGTEMIYIM